MRDGFVGPSELGDRVEHAKVGVAVHVLRSLGWTDEADSIPGVPSTCTSSDLLS